MLETPNPQEMITMPQHLLPQTAEVRVGAGQEVITSDDVPGVFSPEVSVDAVQSGDVVPNDREPVVIEEPGAQALGAEQRRARMAGEELVIDQDGNYARIPRREP